MPSYVSESKLGGSIQESMRMMAEIERISAELPGIDCGACGAPNCRASAEDAVRQGKTKARCLIQEAWKREQP